MSSSNTEIEKRIAQLLHSQFPQSAIIIDDNKAPPTGEYSGILVIQALTVSSITLAGSMSDISSAGAATILGNAPAGITVQPLYFTDISLSGGSAIIF